jgi:bifunctional enzyme CysN/CysC
MEIAPIDAATERQLLRFLTCGSVDDGKSTLIGRLLLDAGAIPDDSLQGTPTRLQDGGAASASPDLAMLVDGLHAEREQGITIDVGYRFFGTAQRRFIIADTPGHEQYTRNMATGASTADLAVMLVDVTKGLRRQTWRHSAIVSLMGIRQVVLAVNKMDLVDYQQDNFAEIVEAYSPIAERLGLGKVTPIPVSALLGDNIVHPSPAMSWYEGPTLLRHLETVVQDAPSDRPFRLAVQWVNRNPPDFRGYSGTVLGGCVQPGDEIVVLPSGVRSRVARIVTYDGDLSQASAGQAVTLTLADPVDVARGDTVAAADHQPHFTDQFAAHLVWLDEVPLLPGRQYMIRLGTATLTARVTELKHQLEMNTGLEKAAKRLTINQIGFANLALDRPAAFDIYGENRDTGSFILVDPVSNATAGAGMIRFPLRRAANLTWQHFSTDRSARSAIKGHRPSVLWFTGLSGAGKSTIADAVEKRLLALGLHTYILDGDNVRHGLSQDLGFTDTDRVENIRRVIEVAHLLADAGLVVLVSFISPFRAERRFARERLAADEFLEIFVDAPLDECERRDPKGLYRKAREGRLANFTGVDSAYEPPENPDIHLRTAEMSLEHEVELIVQALRERGILDRADGPTSGTSE